MPLDFGTAVANIGQTWNSALQNKKAREMQEKQQFIENMLRQDQLALQQGTADRAEDKQVFDQQMELAENYGGRQLPVAQAEQIFTHPKLRDLVMQKLQPRLASTSLQGVGTLGTGGAPNIGVSMEKSEAIQPGMAEITTPVSSGMRIAEMQTEAANARSLQNAELRTTLAEYNAQQQGERQTERLKQQEELANARMQLMASLAGQRNNNNNRTTKLVEDVDETGKPVRRLIDSDTGDIIKTYDKPPTQVKNNMAGSIAEIEAMNESIKRAITLGDKIKWRGIGPFEAPMDERLGRLPGIGPMFTDADEETLRQEIGKVMAHGRHELYGAALTGGERTDADVFLRGINRNNKQVRISLENALRFNDDKLKHLRPAGGMGGAAPTAPAAPVAEFDWDPVARKRVPRKQ
jgi:nucleoid DNA-binding protein